MEDDILNCYMGVTDYIPFTTQAQLKQKCLTGIEAMVGLGGQFPNFCLRRKD
jgi:hypothetical protein